jgi:hypothetical protein
MSPCGRKSQEGDGEAFPSQIGEYGRPRRGRPRAAFEATGRRRCAGMGVLYRSEGAGEAEGGGEGAGMALEKPSSRPFRGSGD